MTRPLSADSPLLQPITVGAWQLPNRIWMAPLTRNRADDDGTSNALMAEYYGQRAGSAALIVSPIDTEPATSGWRLVVPTYYALRVSRDAIYEHAALALYTWRGWI